MFYAYPEGSEPAGTVPVYRFSKAGDGSYFYTVNEIERDWLLKEHADVYTYEGIAFYAYPL